MSYRQPLLRLRQKLFRHRYNCVSRVKCWLPRVSLNGSVYVEQRIFLYESYVKCGSAKKCRRKFSQKFPGTTIPSTTDICKLIKKVRCTCFWTKNPAGRRRVLAETKWRRNKGYIRTRSSEITDKWDTLHRRLASRNHKIYEVNVNLFKRYKKCARVDGQHISRSYKTVKFILLLLWSDTRLALRISCPLDSWVMQLRPAGGQ
jgi:hypothetical protein